RKDPDGCFRHEHAPEYTGVSPVELDGEEIRQRNLDEPEEDEVDARRCDRIAGAVECLYGYHPPAVDKERVRQYPHPFTANGNHSRLIGENGDEIFVKDKIYHRHADKEDHIVEARLPHGRLRPLRM